MGLLWRLLFCMESSQNSIFIQSDNIALVTNIDTDGYMKNAHLVNSKGRE